MIIHWLLSIENGSLTMTLEKMKREVRIREREG